MVEVQAIFVEGMMTAALISAVPLGASFVVGTATALFQAITQIHDQTLSFVPKVIAVSLVLAIFGGWMIETMNEVFQSSLTTAIVAAARGR